ncbi:MAG: molybdopterin-guanine dinucleotide biosynthesis protein B [Candidatus Cloacimonetes bacterium]|nr:molybdopterin-guanine dinucleotide biosynthesis protein B [Candidatus Cloacimonadota bacterium]
MKAIGIIGYHHTGKTTLACAIISQLKSLGYKVVSIKDIHNQNYRVDTEGKNTALHIKAGSEAVFAKGLHDSALIFPHSLNLNEIIPLLKADFLIIEGMKDAPIPKLVCAKSTAELDELIDGTCIGISGIIASELSTYANLPVFCLQKDMAELMNTIMKNSFEVLPFSQAECCSACGATCYQMAENIVQGKATRLDCRLDSNPQISLKINNQEMVIVPFVQNLIRDVILAMVDNLKGIDPKGNISIDIKR